VVTDASAWVRVIVAKTSSAKRLLWAEPALGLQSMRKIALFMVASHVACLSAARRKAGVNVGNMKTGGDTIARREWQS
jgi:hypothetical protein